MRIAYLAPRIDVRSRSAEVVHVFEVASAWKRMGYDVTIFTSRPGGPGGPIDEKFEKFPVKETRNPLSLRVADLAEISYLGRVLRDFVKQRPDIVYLRHFLSSLPARFAATLAGARFFIEVNGIHQVEEHFLSKRYSIFKGFQSLDRRGFQGAERIIAVTPQIAKYLLDAYGVSPGRVSVVHNGANTTLFRPASPDECRAQLGLPLNAPLVAFVGDLARWQGVDLLVRAWPSVLRSCPDAILLIVGGGTAWGELKVLAAQLGAQDSIRFAGPSVYEKVPTYIGASDVAVAPRRRLSSSSSPLKLYEYMACARPVVATNLPEFQVLEESRAGLLVEPEDSDGLAKAISTLLLDGPLRNGMGERGRTLVEKEYSWNTVAARIAAHFQAGPHGAS